MEDGRSGRDEGCGRVTGKDEDETRIKDVWATFFLGLKGRAHVIQQAG
jgi:hypothetical protein